jgi:hypothetical protein
MFNRHILVTITSAWSSPKDCAISCGQEYDIICCPRPQCYYFMFGTGRSGVGSMFLSAWKPGWEGQSGVQDFCFHLLWGGVGAYPQGHVTELQPMWLAGQLVHTSVGRFSLFCENWLVPVLTSCHENLISSLVYFFLAVRTDQVIKISKFSKFTRFSIKAVLAYTIKVGFQIWFSHPSSPIFQKLEFNLILN